MATAFLFVLQAGLGGQTAPSAQSGLYGIAAVATLIGLFSRHALSKLKEIFDVAFAHREDLGEAPPTITQLTPPTIGVRNTATPLTITGSGFTPGSHVEVDSTRLMPT